MKKKTILIISGLQIFPPVSGGQLRTSTLAKAAVAEGHQVVIYSFTGRREDYLKGVPSGISTPHENLREYVDRFPLWGILQFLSYRLGIPPFWLTLLTKFFIPKKLREFLDQSDCTLVDFPYLCPVLEKLPQKGLLNTHNIEQELFKGKISQWVSRVELRAVRAAGKVIFCNEHDRNFFKERLINPPPFILIPNGVDKERLIAFPGEGAGLRRELGLGKDTKVILYSASHYGPNLEALKGLEKFVRENHVLFEKYQAMVVVVGSVCPFPKREKYLIATSRVERIAPYFAMADFGINPLLEGSGTSIKMREYLAAGMPTLTTEFGARGLNLEDDKDCYFFDFSNLASVLQKALEKDGEFLAEMAGKALSKNLDQIDLRIALGKSGIFS